jgi:hypothetical protein
MVELEEGGMFDEDTMPDWMRSMRGVAPANRLQPPPLMAPAPAPFPEPIQQIPPGTEYYRYGFLFVRNLCFKDAFIICEYECIFPFPGYLP